MVRLQSFPFFPLFSSPFLFKYAASYVCVARASFVICAAYRWPIDILPNSAARYQLILVLAVGKGSLDRLALLRMRVHGTPSLQRKADRLYALVASPSLPRRARPL